MNKIIRSAASLALVGALVAGVPVAPARADWNYQEPDDSTDEVLVAAGITAAVIAVVTIVVVLIVTNEEADDAQAALQSVLPDSSRVADESTASASASAGASASYSAPVALLRWD